MMTTGGNGRGLLVAAVALAAACLAGPAWADVAGRVIAVSGQVTAVHPEGAARVLQRGARVHEGEVIDTGDAGRVQVRFVDEGLVDLKPGTRFEIERYDEGSAGSGGSAIMNLLEGALRTISGAIGHGDDDHYSMGTDVATMGIRGTQYALRYCESGCAAGAEGLYGRVDQGFIDVRTGAGQRGFGAGSFFRVAGRDATPEAIVQPPSEVLEQIEGGGRPGAAGTPGDAPDGGDGDGTGRAPSDGGDGEDALERLARLLERAGEELPDDIDREEARAILAAMQEREGYQAGATEVDPESSLLSGVMAGGVAGQGPDGTRVEGGLLLAGVNGDVVVDGKGSITGVELTDGSGNVVQTVDTTGSELVESGRVDALDLRWGRWAGDISIERDGDVDIIDGGMPYAYSTNPTTSGEVNALTNPSATYSLAAAPDAVDGNGNTWSVDTLSLGVDFTSQQITASQLALSRGSASIDVNAASSAPVSLTAGSSGPQIFAFTMDDTGAGGNDSAQVSGHFVGDAAEGAVMSFEARRRDDATGELLDRVRGVGAVQQ